MKHTEISREQWGFFRHKIRSLLRAVPENANVLILHTEAKDIDALIAVLKERRKDFFDKDVLPVVSTTSADDQTVLVLAIAFLIACRDLSSLTGKSEQQLRQEFKQRAINTPPEIMAEMLKDAENTESN